MASRLATRASGRQPGRSLKRGAVGHRLYVAALVLASSPLAVAQIGTGGKGGGLPGGGPGTGTPERTGGGQSADELRAVYHVLDRITYGATQATLDEVRSIGIEDFIRQQLNPGLIPENPQLGALLATLPPVYTEIGDPRWDWDSLDRAYLSRARFSNRQLQEVMTDFWEQHFSTGLDYGDGHRTGYSNSLRFDPTTGEPAIAFTDGLPWFAFREGGVWVREYLPYVGTSTSLAFDLSRSPPAPVVAFYSDNDLELQVSRRLGPGTWSLETVDSTQEGQRHTSLAIDSSGRTWISYMAYDRGAEGSSVLKVASSSGGPWTSVVVDPAPGTGGYSSLALGAGERPWVAYYDAAGERLKYASFDGTVWSHGVVDPGPRVGRYASVAIHPTSLRPSIAYYDEANTGLKFVAHDGAAWGAPVTVDDAGDVGEWASLAFDSAGNPGIAYYDHTGFELNYAHHGGTWTVSKPIAERPGVRQRIAGLDNSLAFNPTTGRPAIAFHNGSRFSAQFAEDVAGVWSAQTVEDFGTSRWHHTVWELEEDDGFRQHALGRFRDLLAVSSQSAAMMLFLNNNENVIGATNENYARELLELHTMGVDGGYSQADVEATARALTGWGIDLTSPACSVVKRNFCYNHLAHDGAAKTIYGKTFGQDAIPDDATNWMKQGEEILDWLSTHPATAKFICGKLIGKFVADEPPADLWQSCRSTFLRTGGDIKRVMATILFSAEFLGTDYHWSKVRTPLEFTMAAVRNLENADVGYNTMYSYLALQDVFLFHSDLPTGYPEAGVDLMSTSAWMHRWQFAETVTFFDPSIALRSQVLTQAPGVVSGEGVLRFFGDRLLRGDLTPTEVDELLPCLEDGRPGSFHIDNPDAESRLRYMVGMMLGFPQYMKQ